MDGATIAMFVFQTVITAIIAALNLDPRKVEKVTAA